MEPAGAPPAPWLRLRPLVFTLAVTLMVAFVGALLVAVTPAPEAAHAATVPNAPNANALTPNALTPNALPWHDCGDGFECSTLTVPVDYARPEDAALDVAIVRLPATDPRARHRSLVFNFGGPGDPATETLRRSAASMPAAIRARFDLVAFDPRGTGSSRPVDCIDDSTFPRLWSEDGTPASDADLPRYYDGSAASLDFIGACIATQGDWLARVGTRNVARDLDRLRAALGERRLTFVGYSYGTVLGAVYAQEFPKRVRALVLDSAVDLSETAAARQRSGAAGFEHALDAFLGDCAADTACEFHSDGDPRAALTRLRDRFEAGLILRTGDGRTVGVSEFYTALLTALYSRAAWPTLARGLHDAARGRTGRYLGALDDAYTGRRDDGTYNNFQEAIGLIVCADRPDPRVSFDEYAATFRELSAKFPFFGPVLGGSPAGCDPRLPRPAPAEVLGDVRTDTAPPVLVVGTTHDPATPYAGARDLQRRLRGSRILTVDDTQHGGFAQGNACVDQAVSQYLLEGVLPRRGTRCAP